MQSQRETQEAAEAAGKTTMDPAVLASAASVALSWYYFFGRGEPEKGLFVGLWPPTFLAFASYFEQTRMSDMVERAAGGRPGKGIVRRVERVMQNR